MRRFLSGRTNRCTTCPLARCHPTAPNITPRPHPHNRLAHTAMCRILPHTQAPCVAPNLRSQQTSLFEFRSVLSPIADTDFVSRVPPRRRATVDRTSPRRTRHPVCHTPYTADVLQCPALSGTDGTKSGAARCWSCVHSTTPIVRCTRTDECNTRAYQLESTGGLVQLTHCTACFAGTAEYVWGTMDKRQLRGKN